MRIFDEKNSCDKACSLSPVGSDMQQAQRDRSVHIDTSKRVAEAVWTSYRSKAGKHIDPPKGLAEAGRWEKIQTRKRAWQRQATGAGWR